MKTVFTPLMSIIISVLLDGNTALRPYFWKTNTLQRIHRGDNGENVTVCDETSRSIIAYTEVQHRWIIEHFQEQELIQTVTKARMQSAEFSSPDKRHRFRIVIQTDNQGPHRRTQRLVTLNADTDNESLTCVVQFAIPQRTNRSLSNLPEKLETVKRTRGGMEIAKQALPDNLDQHIDNDALVILCTVTIYERSTTICDSDSQRDEDSGKAFVDSFKGLLDNKTGSDLEIIAKSCVINAHKSILLARNLKMVTLIRNQTEGNKQLNATQYSCDAMRCVVEYVYTNKCSLKPEIAEEVLLAASQYQLTPLKRIAERVLIKCLNEENIASNIMLAKNTSSNALLRSISRFITRNPHILNSPTWKEMEMKNTRQAAFILRETVLQ
uniref:BTB domain-containing protein n=1 Tax=Trichuris muris TaxID=70415 RepID=A0A5S6QN62_TRIMR